MSETVEDVDALNDLARKYLDLWLEHWSSCLAAPETSTVMAGFLSQAGGAMGSKFAGFDPIASWPGARNEPAAFRTAPNAGDGRADEFEKRIAALERRLAELEPNPASGAKSAAPKSARKPRRRPDAV